jgi:hypothetical protein
MAFFNFKVDTIAVHKAGYDELEPFGEDWFDTDNNEWRVHITAETESGSFKHESYWQNDNVKSGSTHEVGNSTLGVLAPGEKIKLNVTAWEGDWLTADDHIVGIENLVLDPATMGNDYNLVLGDANQEYYYTLNLDSFYFG